MNTKSVGGRQHVMIVDGYTYILDGAREYVRRAGRRVRRWHRFIKGWCEKLGKMMCFCLGIVKDLKAINSWIDYQGGEAMRQARIMFDHWLEKLGAGHALVVLKLANWWV